MEPSDDGPWNLWPTISDRWHRLADDVRRTVGRILTLTPSEDDPGAVAINLDGVDLGAVGFWASDAPEEALAHLADALREHSLDEEIWGGWPTCPEHHTHPLDSTVVDGVACWTCPTLGGATRIGDLAAVG